MIHGFPKFLLLRGGEVTVELCARGDVGLDKTRTGLINT